MQRIKRTMEGYDFRAIDKIKQNLTLRLEFILTEISTTGRFQAEKSNYLFYILEESVMTSRRFREKAEKPSRRLCMQSRQDDGCLISNCCSENVRRGKIGNLVQIQPTAFTDSKDVSLKYIPDLTSSSISLLHLEA